MKALAVDYGERFVGLAMTDGDGRIALRHSTLDQRGGEAVKRIAAMVRSENATVVLVGVPVSLRGGVSEQTRSCRRFIERLRPVLPAGVAVLEVDERLTSREAARLINAEGGRPEDEHAEAARLLLNDWLQREG